VVRSESVDLAFTVSYRLCAAVAHAAAGSRDEVFSRDDIDMLTDARTWATIQKPRGDWAVTPNLLDYAAGRKALSCEAGRDELMVGSSPSPDHGTGNSCTHVVLLLISSGDLSGVTRRLPSATSRATDRRDDAGALATIALVTGASPGRRRA
jgi:hypothetical protein